MNKTANTHYIVRTGQLVEDRPATAWLQIERVRDERVDLVEYEPAVLGGWKFRKATTFAGDDWDGWDAEAILKFKCESDAYVRATPDQIESCDRFADAPAVQS